MIKTTTPKRTQDVHGSGEWGASRGSRVHKGIDYAVWPNSTVLSLTEGIVTKLGYAYSDDLSFRYIEITRLDKHCIRYFYVEPDVSLGDIVEPGQPLGIAQDLRPRYKGITPHVHLGVMSPLGEYLNPEVYFGEDNEQVCT